MSEKYKIYRSVFEECIYIRKCYGYSRELLTYDKLMNLKVENMAGYELFLSDSFLKYEKIKEIETDKDLDINDEVCINDEMYIIKKKAFNLDSNCYNVYVDSYKSEELPSEVRELFIRKRTELREINKKLIEDSEKKSREIQSKLTMIDKIKKWFEF